MILDRETADLREAQAGREAEAALAVVGQHFDHLRAQAWDVAVRSAPDALALRERMIVTCQVVDAMRHALERAISGGAAAEIRLLQAQEA